jgi:catechol 2,3-dioxygenase-like lactoylglutathione lyase family enzyme
MRTHFSRTSATLVLLTLGFIVGAPAQQVAAPAQSKPQTLPAVAIPAGQSHIVGAAKLIVEDANEAKTYYEQYFGMQEVSHYSAKDVYDEPIMGFVDGARLALFQPLAEAPIKKSQFPVALVYTPDFETLVKRLEDAKEPVLRLPAAQAGPYKIAIARDPAGNAIEIFSRAGKLEVGGSKLIVSDRQKAEDFFTKVFGAKPGQRFQTPAYDEVLMNFGEGAFLALFQPKGEAPLPKSKYPVVAIYTKEFDTVLGRVKELALGYREVASSTPGRRIIIAQDPAGNAVEIIAR